MLSESLKHECKRLVDRARHGDQNAMAMIEQIGKNAKGGLGDVAYMLRDYANGLRWSMVVPECKDEIPGPPPDWRFGQDTK